MRRKSNQKKRNLNIELSCFYIKFVLEVLPEQLEEEQGENDEELDLLQLDEELELQLLLELPLDEQLEEQLIELEDEWLEEELDECEHEDEDELEHEQLK